MTFIHKIKEKGIPLFLAKVFVFLAILIILDFSIGSTLKYFYFRQESGLLYRTTYSLDSTRAEFLILGSSTANHHYDSRIFEKRFRTSTYNTGRDANTIFYNYAIFQSVLKRYKPKVVILDFNVKEFKANPDNYDRISSLLPYYKEHPEIHSIIELKSSYEKYKLLSKIYPFNSLLFTIVVGTTDFNKSREQINDENGYVPLIHIWNKKISIDTDTIKYKIDTNKVNILKSFIQECNKAGIQLYIIISPRFIKYFGNDLSVELVHKIADKYNIPFYDYSKDTLFWKNREYFADRVHLNNTGAVIFSNKVIDTILRSKEYLRLRNKNNLSINK
jgi:hypothetical protein